MYSKIPMSKEKNKMMFSNLIFYVCLDTDYPVNTISTLNFPKAPRSFIIMNTFTQSNGLTTWSNWVLTHYYNFIWTLGVSKAGMTPLRSIAYTKWMNKRYTFAI